MYTFTYDALQVSTDAPVLPNRDLLEQELFALMRQMGKRNHRGKNDLHKLMKQTSAPQPAKNQCPIWPKYKGPQNTDSRNLGKSSVFLYRIYIYIYSETNPLEMKSFRNFPL